MIKQDIYHFWLSFILSERLSNSLWGLNVLLFPEFINKLSILLDNYIEFIILLYTFLVMSIVQYMQYMIWWILFSKFLDVLPAFPCASDIGNLWNICLGLNILSPFSYFTLYLASDTKKA